MAKVLLADDEVTMVQMVTELLRAEGHEVFPFTNGNAALEAIETVAPELVVTDLYLDKTRAQGLDILHKARSLNPPAVVIVITGFGTIDTAVEAMKKGAYDYLKKPFKLDELQQPPAVRALRPGQLQRPAGKPARVRTFRPSQGSLHRRHQRQKRPVPG